MVCKASSPKPPVKAANSHPTSTPMRMDRRESSPRVATVTTTTVSSVTPATQGWVSTLETAVGARLKPMSATMAPVTTGGMTASMTRLPAHSTMMPTRMSAAPVSSTPPSCAPTPYCCEAVNGAMKAKDEPR